MKIFEMNDFPLVTFDKLRYSDTDSQGHVNNAVFSTFLETGRVEILYNSGIPIATEDSSFVIASLKLDFIHEIKWPGQIDIGTGITKIGNSSIVIFQMLFQNEILTAKAETVIVQVNKKDGKSSALSQFAKDILSKWLLN